MKFIIPVVFSLLGGCLPVTVLTGVVSVGDSYLKEMKIEKLKDKKQVQQAQLKRSIQPIQSSYNNQFLKIFEDTKSQQSD